MIQKHKINKGKLFVNPKYYVTELILEYAFLKSYQTLVFPQRRNIDQ